MNSALKNRLQRIERGVKKQHHELQRRQMEKRWETEHDWEHYEAALQSTMSVEHQLLMDEAVLTLVWEGEEYSYPGETTFGHLLFGWKFARYEDFKEDRPVSLAPAIAAQLQLTEDCDLLWDCEDCHLSVPEGLERCPLCGGMCGLSAYDDKHEL